MYLRRIFQHIFILYLQIFVVNFSRSHECMDFTNLGNYSLFSCDYVCRKHRDDYIYIYIFLKDGIY